MEGEVCQQSVIHDTRNLTWAGEAKKMLQQIQKVGGTLPTKDWPAPCGDLSSLAWIGQAHLEV